MYLAKVADYVFATAHDLGAVYQGYRLTLPVVGMTIRECESILSPVVLHHWWSSQDSVDTAPA